MFKLLSFLTVTLIISHPPLVFANENNNIFCTSIGEIAGRAMGARLSGIPINDLLNIKFNPAIQAISQAIIKDAYSRPLSGSEKDMVKNMSDFRNEVELNCHKSLGE